MAIKPSGKILGLEFMILICITVFSFINSTTLGDEGKEIMKQFKIIIRRVGGEVGENEIPEVKEIH